MSIELWVEVAGFLAILGFLWRLTQDVASLRERMAKLEGVVEGFLKGQQNG